MLVLALAMILAWRTYTGPVPRLNAPVEQPIPFSHKHHVGDDGLDCRYCHTSVEKSSFAGMPSTELCLTCHSQLYKDSPMLAPLRDSLRTGRPIKWNRVHDLPDFVYFNHSIHIMKGVGCATCHGQVDEMPLIRRTESLEMQWCLSCHRGPEKFLRPKERIFDMNWRPSPEEQEVLGRTLLRQNDIQKNRITDCSTCHR